MVAKNNENQNSSSAAEELSEDELNKVNGGISKGDLDSSSSKEFYHEVVSPFVADKRARQ